MKQDSRSKESEEAIRGNHVKASTRGNYELPAIIYRGRIEAVAGDCSGASGKSLGVCSIGAS
jgi:hypothetical protein